MSHDDLNWFCLTVRPKAEFMAENVLRQIGFCAFVPTELKWPRKRRRRPDYAAEPHRYPLLGSRYVLAGFEYHLPMWELSELGFVTGFVGVNGFPAQFPVEAIEYLMDKSHQNIPWKQAPNPHKSFKPGDTVSVIDGSFEGHTVKIEGIQGATASFIFEMLGKAHLVHVPLEFVESM